ncbi:Tfp pilus assembly protein PilX [Pseudarthrobacter oxydans]|uniref:Tfp pilus assembly protein PilX n=1 Tax=Pseudarthrobacter oxydans TaxID=1671 RepID=A0AAW8N8X8_PSEOX|nr:Tfp pilus assembly protein PilX [Pseudarthrobacter oxydans]MDR7163921.1 Tfp pilus assembly protein PilX [Pseudarthrobacter oxydans]
MESNTNYDMAFSAARRLFTFMGRAGTDPTEVRVAKEIFRWTAAAAGASVVAVVVLQSCAVQGE